MIEEDHMARVLLERLFPSRLVSDVRTCRNCPSPVVHMEHLTLPEALDLEQRIHTLLGHDEKETWDDMDA